MKIFKTLEEVYKATQPHQVTVQELINGRTKIEGEWQEFRLDDNLMNAIAFTVANKLGGIKRTKDHIENVILFRRPQHWGLERFVLKNYHSVCISYIAGQDQPTEMKVISKYLNNI